MVLDSQPISLYLHFPFCHHKCSYCDLNAYAGLDHLIPAYIAALVSEVRLIGQLMDDRVHTLYFGGGTPSITPLPLLAGVFAAIRESFMLGDDCEVSLEANPDTVDLAYLEGLRVLGVNRLSIGAQSAQGNELTLFQRTHTFDEVASAVGLAREAGFDNVSLDLIYGAPGQTMISWRDTLQQHVALDVEHFSIYALSLDFGTPMRAWVNRGLLPEPDGDLAAEMYEWADEELARAGFAQYEISSWAREESPKFQTPNSKFACRHNLQYWHNLPYLGLGAGAHGCYGGYRYSNVASPTAYISRLAENETKPLPFSPALAESIPIDARTEMSETMLTGLRLTREGVRERDFRERYR
ncbi:MAG: radical SAM family heme chaperone HemW, partial [Chloroflexota bacterium]